MTNIHIFFSYRYIKFITWNNLIGALYILYYYTKSFFNKYFHIIALLMAYMGKNIIYKTSLRYKKNLRN